MTATGYDAVMAEFGAEAAAEQAKHVALLERIRTLREVRNEADKAEKPLSAQLRQYLELEGLPELVDGEHGLRAYLEERGAWEWDLRNATDALVLALARTGLLSVDNRAYDALLKAAPTLELQDAGRYRRRVQGSVALKVEQVRS